ncbi:unnamed protein product [Closterium sp. Naga37s-1]|nr:unnamed protein product [Closterium sp. Naga37s-1]
MVASKGQTLLILQAFKFFWLHSLLISASTCHAVIHSGALNADRPAVAGGGATAARIADAAGLPVAGASRRILCDDNSTDGNKRDSTKNTPVTIASQPDGGSNRTSAFTGSAAVRNSKDEKGNQVVAGAKKSSSARAEGEGENVGYDTDAGKSIKRERHDSSQSDGREERKEKEEREENNEKKDGNESEKKETRGRSDNGNTHEQSNRERKEAGKVGNATKGGGNGDESKTRERSDGGDSSRVREDHTKCNDSSGNSSEEESSANRSSGSGTDVSLADRLGGWSGGAGGNEKLPSSLAALLADTLIRLTASARIRIDGQGLDLGRRAGRQGSSPKPISTAGHSPARSSEQVLANPLMAVNLFVFNKPIEISAVHSFVNKGSVSLQTQLALTTALARDNATVTQDHPQFQESGLGNSQAPNMTVLNKNATTGDSTASLGSGGDGGPPLPAAAPLAPSAVAATRGDAITGDSQGGAIGAAPLGAQRHVASSAALGAASEHRELAEAHELLGDPPEVHAGSSPVHVSSSPVHVNRGNRRKLAVVAAVDEETRRGMEAWMQDEVKRAVSRGLKQLQQKLLEDVDKLVRKLQQGSHCGGKKRSGSRGKGGSHCKKRSKCGKSHKSKKSKEHYSDSSLWKPSLLAHKPFPSSINIRSYVFQGPVEISGIRELNNSGTITRQTQIAITKATAKDNGTVSQNEPQSQRSAHGAAGMEGGSMGSGGGGGSQSEERVTYGKHGDEKSHYQGQHGEGSGGGEKHGKIGEVKEIVGEVKKHGVVGAVGGAGVDDGRW